MSTAARVAVVVLVGLFLVGFVLAAALFGALSDDRQDGYAGAICGPPTKPGTAVAGLDAEQMRNVAAIVIAGTRLRVPSRADVVAVATAMQESALRNLGGGDRDSVGLFQQRPSQGWGSLAEITDPVASATTFFRVLLTIPGWERLPLTVAAQRVQRSGLPDAYARWESLADAAVGAVGGVACDSPGAPGGANTDVNAARVVAAAVSQVGVPYAWGGGDPAGPTRGVSDGGGAADAAGDSTKVGFDCSGLAQFAWAQAGIAVPHQNQAIWSAFPPATRDRGALRPGDLLLLSNTGAPSGIHHVGIYLGNDQVVEAPSSGLAVRVVADIWNGPDRRWSDEFVGAVRPGVSPPPASPSPI